MKHRLSDVYKTWTPGPWTTSLDPVHGPLYGPPVILRDNPHKMAEGICGADWPDSSDSAEDESSCSKSLTQMASLKVRWLWFALLGITDSIP
ncbi:uncharacterized protein LOC141859031 isoform X2 [Acropora palmata]|uniref:uncharacterized protein LOC141859031 isoform X2 n=1 Tax=Acropora palmata TaxID=6131 RepID=UPI003DA13418